MAAQIPSRAMTFTGCWTCKSRKVRCDKRPVACQNCEKRGVPCGGYGIRLQWVSDPITECRKTQKVQGRMSMKLDQNSLVYAPEEIDELLLRLDENAENSLSSRHGPFSAFATTRNSHLHENSPFTLLGSSSSPTAISPQLEVSTEAPSSQQSLAHEIVPISSQDGHVSLASEMELLPLDATIPWSPIFSNLESLPMDAYLLTDVSLGQDLLSEQLSTGSRLLGENQDQSTSDTAMTTAQVNCGIPQAIISSLFQDSEIDELVGHYHIHVAGLIIPVDHSDNPYRRLYLSTAIEGIMNRESRITTSKEMACNALYQSLLASAAYHRWYSDQTQNRYREIATQYRYQAMQSLQNAVQEAAPEANYQILMITILSFITIGVLSGDGDEFRIHIEAASRLRNSRSNWKLLSRQSKQINEISAFLDLLSRTMSFRPSLLKWTGQSDRLAAAEDRIIRSSGCYEYVYGITPTIAAALNTTCRLAEHLLYIRQNNKDDTNIPDGILEACEELGNTLQSWQFEREDITSIPRSDVLGFSILTHQAKAWHAAALVYYCTRIQGAEPIDVIRETDLVMKHLLTAEDIKSKAGTIQQKQHLAPITWPGFIASCNILKDRRDAWKEWWQHMLAYKIGNIEKQWDVVQKIWEKLDEMEQLGMEIDWTVAFESLGTNILPT